MIDLHRILVPTDFSKYSENALTYATAFAQKFGTELYLLHVASKKVRPMTNVKDGSAALWGHWQPRKKS